MPNTKIMYMYRDEDNYKINSYVVLKGEMADLEKKALIKKLDEDRYFIPSQVGLTDLQESMSSPIGDRDHVWHELQDDDITLTDDDPCNTGYTDVHGLVMAFLAVKEWDVLKAMEDVGIPMSPSLQELKTLRATPYKELPLLINHEWASVTNEKLYQARLAKGK